MTEVKKGDEKMKGVKRLSPFQELLKAIENEAYDFELRCKSHNFEELNADFCRGYKSAINSVLTVALSIYDRGLSGKYLMLDIDSHETTQKLLDGFKKEG